MAAGAHREAGSHPSVTPDGVQNNGTDDSLCTMTARLLAISESKLITEDLTFLSW